jgi:hypothetical protein
MRLLSTLEQGEAWWRRHRMVRHWTILFLMLPLMMLLLFGGFAVAASESFYGSGFLGVITMALSLSTYWWLFAAILSYFERDR